MTTTEAADELQERCAQRGEVPDFLLDFLEAHDTGMSVQLPLPSKTASRQMEAWLKRFERPQSTPALALRGTWSLRADRWPLQPLMSAAHGGF